MKSFFKLSIAVLFHVLLVCLLVMPLSGQAQTFNFKPIDLSNIKTAASLKAHGLNDTIIVSTDIWDEMVSTSTTYNNNFKFKSVNAYVRFAVDYGYKFKVPTPYTLRMAFKVYGFSNPATPNIAAAPIFDTLTISYNPDSLSSFQDRQYKKFSNYHKIMIVITGLYKIDNALSVPQPIVLGANSTFNLLNFKIEGNITLQPYYKKGKSGSYFPAYGPAGTLAVKSLPPVNDYLPVIWNLKPATLGANLTITPAKYELEWTYIDNYKVAPNTASGPGTVTEIPVGSLDYNFVDNATRVWVDSNYYRIPLIYQKGYVAYRVRLVRPDSVEYKYPVYGPWTTVAPTGLVSALDAASFFKITTAHLNDSLNWQYTVSFAEQGKYKHVMSYYDGMLKNRQSITRFNSTPNKLIATEQIYDYEGRPSISILPTPINSLAFRYQLNLSLNKATNLPYKAKDFDSLRLSTCPGEVLLPALANNALANIYYSPLNPDKAAFQRFVPNAKGYPLVQTIYSPGYDERVEKQGGAGDTLQIGHEHNVKNDYVGTEQTDLNRLFGTNIGWSGFYRKTVSRDPNDQLSLNITDYKGKTMMSSMIGLPDTMKHALVSNTNLTDSVLYTEDFLAGVAQQIIGNKRILDKNFFNEANGNNIAQYVYAFKPFQTFCPGIYLSLRAHYSYDIFDECGVNVAHSDSTLGKTGITTIAIADTFKQDTLGFYMDKGKHSLHKELTINRDDVAAAVDSFMALPPSQACLKTEPWFIKESVLSKQFPCPADLHDADCNDCDGKKYSMLQELYPNQDSSYVKRKYGIYRTINGVVVGNANSDFTILCDNGHGWTEYPAEAFGKETLNIKVGIWDNTSSTIHTPGGPFVILNNDTLNCRYRYQDPCVVNMPASITKYGQTYTNLQQIPVEDFINIFNDTIAEALLPLHPEYCDLLNCVDDPFYKKMQSIPDAKIAEQLGLMYLSDIIHADPLYAKLQTLPAQYPHPFDTLATMAKGTLQLNILATTQAYCGSADNSMTNQCQNYMFAGQIASGTLDNPFVKGKYFISIRDLYLYNRERYLFNLKPNNGGCNVCAPIRMDLVPGPIFGHPNSLANAFDTIFNTSTIPPSAGNTSSVISQYLSLVNTVNLDTLQQDANSAVNSYLATSNLIMQVAVDSIIKDFVNCAPQNSMNGVRNFLMNLYNTGQVTDLQFTPNQILAALKTNNINRDDLCNPYVVNYDGLVLPPPENDDKSGLLCGSDALFVDLNSFLNGTSLQALRNLNVSFPVALSGTPVNQFAQNMSSQLNGANSCNAVATLDAVQKLYCLTYSAGSNSMKIFIKADPNGICQFPFTVNAGETVSIEAQCNKQTFGGFASGYIGAYSFGVVAKHTSSTGTTVCKLKAWNDKVVVNAFGENPIANCVPCTQMKTLYTQLWDTLRAYSVKGTDHPNYSKMLRNFMNFQLHKAFTGDQYLDFIESCALSDHMRIDRYPYYFKKFFTNSAAGTTFLNQINALDTNIVITPTLRYTTNGSAGEEMDLDLSAVPSDKLLVYKNFITNYATGTTSNYSNFLTSSIASQNYLGSLYVPNSSSFIPTTAMLGSSSGTGYFYIVVNPTINLWNGTTYEPYRSYSVATNNPNDFSQNNKAIDALRTYITDNGVPVILHPGIQTSINDDYYLPEKQALLNYTYNYQSLPANRVLDTLQAQNIYTLFNPTFSLADGLDATSYGNISNPGAIQNLYINDPSVSQQGTHAGILNTILNKVKDQLSGGLFFGTGSNTINISSAPNNMLTAYRCRDTAFWYRYFGEGDTLYNVFIKVPSYIDPDLMAGYKMQSFKTMPGDGNSRAFYVILRNPNAPIKDLKVNGYTDFTVMKNLVLDNVLLAHPVDEGIPVADTVDNCERNRLITAIIQGKVNYKIYIDSIKNQLNTDFYAYAMNNGIYEALNISYRNQRFNYTLYNYDRAGNLTTTISPGGVYPLTTNLQNIDPTRASGIGGIIPYNQKSSLYQYNTLNQVVNQQTPDAGLTDFYYDAAGRVIFSQNAKQRPSGQMTYTLYDEQGRIVETGQATIGCKYFSPISNANVNTPRPACSYFDANTHTISALPMIVTDLVHTTPQQIASFIKSLARDEVVVTNYDAASVNLGTNQGLSNQDNLRKRVASIKYFNSLASTDVDYVNYTYAMHFSYDIEGNVKTLTRDYPTYKVIGQQFKRIDYDYDVISGKVNLLSYNRGFPDQFYQKYAYDDDNRIIEVNTSNDGVIWQKDASYEYYQHGPLARMNLGDLNVQGVDYAYTIQGWLKAINGDALTASKDMGSDAVNITANPHRGFANDAAALTLDYFKGDYSPIGTDSVTHLSPLGKNLYNGNIPRATTSILPFPDLASTYTYDQLNRIVRADYAKMNRTETAPLTSTADYYSSYAYDPDGNLKKLVRNGNQPAHQVMDSLNYYYTNYSNTGLVNNRLVNITDMAGNFYTNDIKPFSNIYLDRYKYDPIGNVIQDQVSGQGNITWNHYNKVISDLSSTNGQKLSFDYDGAGNRYRKSVTVSSNDTTNESTDYYVRDAQGNILAIYKDERNTYATKQQWIEYITGQIYKRCDPILYVEGYIIPNYGFDKAFYENVLKTALNNTSWSNAILSDTAVSLLASNNTIFPNVVNGMYKYNTIFADMARYSRANNVPLLTTGFNASFILGAFDTFKVDYSAENFIRNLFSIGGKGSSASLSALCSTAPSILKVVMDDYKIPGYQSGNCANNTEQIAQFLSANKIPQLNFLNEVYSVGKQVAPAQYNVFLQKLYGTDAAFYDTDEKSNKTGPQMLCKYAPNLFNTALKELQISIPQSKLISNNVTPCDRAIIGLNNWIQNAPDGLSKFNDKIIELSAKYSDEFNTYANALNTRSGSFGNGPELLKAFGYLTSLNPDIATKVCKEFGIKKSSSAQVTADSMYRYFIKESNNDLLNKLTSFLKVNGCIRKLTDWGAPFIDSISKDADILSNSYYMNSSNGTLLPILVKAMDHMNFLQFGPFLDQWPQARALLRSTNDDEAILRGYYFQAPTKFLVGYINANDGNLDILQQSLAAIPDLQLNKFVDDIYRTPTSQWCLTTVVLDSIIHNLYTNGLQARRMYLASHHIYGSSRLGTKDYLPGQFYQSYDYTKMPVEKDTASLLGYRPWYSLEYKDVIQPQATEPYGLTYLGSYYLSHQIGQKQYELNNHLGNVQATITDLPVYVGRANDTISTHRPAIAAAYDYYPFGMLMPDRYVSDTTAKCYTITKSEWVTKTIDSCYDVYRWIWPRYTAINGGVATFKAGTDFVDISCARVGSEVNFTFGVTPQTEQFLQINISELPASDLLISKGLAVIDEEDGNGGWKQLTSAAIQKAGLLTLQYTPTRQQMRLRFIGPIWIKVKTVCITKKVQVQQSYLADICSGVKDRYRFGFNGKEKINELAGIGNMLDYGARWEDTRIARLGYAVDPLTKQYPMLSPYQFSSNSPISNIDLDGEEAKSTTGAQIAAAGTTATKLVIDEGLKRAAIEGAKNGAVTGGRLGVGELVKDAAAGVGKAAGTAVGTVVLVFTPVQTGNPEASPSWREMQKHMYEQLKPERVNPLQPEKKKEEEYITLYRGVGEDIIPSTLYAAAQRGIAVPKGFTEDPFQAHSDAEYHSGGGNNSIFTSWSTDKSTAELFARGPLGNTKGVILEKKFKKNNLVRSETSYIMGEGEYLVPGVVTGAKVEQVIPTGIKITPQK